jgi:N6-adenosine-specific RNA methylase IME4/ParB-like chromosome segregation protein Spo0J
MTDYLVSELRPHPRNVGIYGDENIDELAERIQSSGGWIKPLVITSHGMIISGHRRWKAAQKLGMDTVSVEIRRFANETEELEALLLENVTREKTDEQKVREGKVWREIDAERNRERKIAHLKQGNVAPVVENFPQREPEKTRDAVAVRVGFGTGRTYDKADQVVTIADEIRAAGDVSKADALLNVLNTQSVDAAHKLTKQSPSVRDAALTTIASKPTIKAQDALRQATNDRRAKEDRTDALKATAQGKYRVILADPPWSYTMFNDEGDRGAAATHYNVMTIDELAALPISNWAANECALLMWVTWPNLFNSQALFKAWGFEYRTCAFVWAKANASTTNQLVQLTDDSNWFFGMGTYTRANTEFCLLGVRGSIPVLDHAVRQLIVSPIGEHSAKPAEQYGRIERLFGGPYLELFARGSRPGWSVWGNQVTEELG